MTHANDDDISAGEQGLRQAGKLTEDDAPGSVPPGKAPLTPDAAALVESNLALQATLEELREARDRLCHEADEFEHRIRERTAELEAIITSLPEAVYIGDEDGIFRCNRRALENLGCESIAELQAQIAVLSAKLQNRYADTGEPIAPEDEAFARALRGQPWTYEVISKNLRTGEDVIQRCAANPIVLDGEIVGAVAINTDITEQKRTEQALREAVARLSEREAALVQMTGKLRTAHDELEARVAERTAAVAASEAQLRTLTHRLVQVQEDERRALARDLHDTAAQAMTVINLGLAMLRREAGGASDKTRGRIDELRQVADTVAEDLHRLAVNLRPSTLDRYGLVPALDELINTMRKQATIEIDFQVEGLEERLPDEMETALYRIVQEATTNISRYADASHASISLRRHGSTLRLDIEDNGRGFDTEEALSRGRLGLLGMRERTEMLGGALVLESRPGHGTRLRVEAPLAMGASTADAPAIAADPTALPEQPNLVNEPSQDAQATPSHGASAAAELARAKALSDVLVDISAGMGRAASAADMLEFILARAAEAIGCEVATFMEREDGGFLISHGYNAPPGLVGRRLSDREAPTTAQAVETRELVVVNNLEELDPGAGRAAASFALSSFACVPLISGDRVLGVANFSYHTLHHGFAPSEVDFLKRLASLVSLGLENIHLREVEAEQRRQLEASNARLAEERDRLSVLLTHIPDEVWFADAAANVLAANPAAVRGVGLEPTGEPFQPFPDWVSLEIRNPNGEPRPVEQTPLLRALRGERVERQEEMVRKRLTGEWRHRQASGEAIRDSSGQIVGAVLVVRDITEQKQAETARERAREHAESLAAERDIILESIADGLVVYDADGRIVRMNAVAEQMLAYDKQAQATTVRERTATAVEVRRPDGSAFAFDEYPAVRALRGEVVRNEDIVFRLKTGMRSDLRASVSSAPIRSREGDITGCVTTITNTEAYHQAMDQLQAANARLTERESALQRTVAELDGILDALPSGLIVYDTEGRIVRMNGPAQDMLGYDDEVWQRSVSERATVAVQVFRPDGSPYAREEFAALRALRGEAVHNEDTFVHLPASPERDFWAMISACPIVGAGGMRLGAVVTLADTSELHRVSEQLRRANAEMEAILESIPDGLVVNDVNGRVSRMNRVAEEMLRYTAEERALPISERLPEKMRLFRSDGSPYSYDEYPPVRALAGEVTHGQELIMRTPDRPDQDVWVLASAGPIWTEQGETLGAVTILTDISVLHETRTHLQEANAVLVRQAEQLRDAGDRLEQRVRERTASLQQATEALERAQAELQALSRRLVQMQEEERSYVADQLYNQAAQVLAALKMQLWSLERSQQHEASAAQLAEMKSTLDHAIQALHDLAAQLRPAALDRLTLATMLRDYVTQYVEAQGLSFHFDAGGTEDLRVPTPVVTAVFRSVQEALANIERHASASRVMLALSRVDNLLVVTLTDNGIGFNLADATQSGGVGLIGMRERIESVEGQLKVDSTPAGTTITITVPVDPEL